MIKVGMKLLGIIILISGIATLCVGVPHGLLAIGAGLYIIFDDVSNVE